MELPTQESGPASPLAETVLRGPPPLSGPMTGRNPASGNGKEHHSLETAGLLSAASNHLPQMPKVSQGLSGGTIEQQVNPVYPNSDSAPKEGRVLLQAVVAEDGTVHDLKVITGNPLLARAAIQAVSQWRYRPYMLDGKPIRRTIEITLLFKRP